MFNLFNIGFGLLEIIIGIIILIITAIGVGASISTHYKIIKSIILFFILSAISIFFIYNGIVLLIS